MSLHVLWRGLLVLLLDTLTLLALALVLPGFVLDDAAAALGAASDSSSWASESVSRSFASRSLRSTGLTLGRRAFASSTV